MKRLALFSLVLTATECLAAPLSGKIAGASPQEYKVVAVGKSGRTAISTVAANGKFTVNAKGGDTLHLVRASGAYFGPLVVPSGRKALTTSSGSRGNVGNVSLKGGFATVSAKKAGALFAQTPKVSFNTRTGPAGAGKLGFVSTAAASARPGIRAASGQDADKDGLPNILDIDDDGDLVLDATDSSGGGISVPPLEGEIRSTLRIPFATSLNANASGVTDAAIDERLKAGLILGFHFRKSEGQPALSSVNIDCSTLSYCRPGSGTAAIRSNDVPQLEGAQWVTNYDTDGDTLPNLFIKNTQPIAATMGVKPGATRSEINPGDTIFFKAAFATGAAATVPSVIPFYFVTGPAIKSYDAGAGTVSPSYPVSNNEPGVSVNNPINLTGQTITLQLWRPQRPAIAGAETPGLVDIGQLTYGILLSPAGQSSGPIECTRDDFTNLSDKLTANTNPGAFNVLKDTALDAPLDPNNTLTFTFNVAQCLARRGVSTSGTTVFADVSALTERTDETSLGVYFKLPS